MSRERFKHVVCPICGTQWATGLRTAGTLCRDKSQGQVRGCVGRVMRSEDMRRAEWRPKAWTMPWLVATAPNVESGPNPRRPTRRNDSPGPGSAPQTPEGA